jgi:putative redox protein
MAMYRVEVTAGKDSPFKVTSRDYEFFVDTKGRGVTPPDVLLASLASCICVYIRKYAEGAKMTLDDFTVIAEAEFSKEPPFCFREIKVAIDLKGVSLEERRKQALLEFIKNCPVHNTLKATPHIEVAVT